jgi:hypothetical protein
LLVGLLNEIVLLCCGLFGCRFRKPFVPFYNIQETYMLLRNVNPILTVLLWVDHQSPCTHCNESLPRFKPHTPAQLRKLQPLVGNKVLFIDRYMIRAGFNVGGGGADLCAVNALTPFALTINIRGI